MHGVKPFCEPGGAKIHFQDARLMCPGHWRQVEARDLEPSMWVSGAADLGVGLKAFCGAPRVTPPTSRALEHQALLRNMMHADLSLELKATSAVVSPLWSHQTGTSAAGGRYARQIMT